MPDINDLIVDVTHEVKRFGADIQKVHSEAKQSVDQLRTDIHERIDAVEVALKRGGGQLGGPPETAEQREYKSAFQNFVRTGENTNLKALQQKALSTGSDVDGGYFVPPQLADRIITRVREVSPLRRLANVQTVSTGEAEFLMDLDEAGATWVDETSPRQETSTPQLGKRRITAHELSASPLITQRMLEDANINVDEWLANKIADRFARTEGAAFVTGTGVGQPRGFATYPVGEQGEAIKRVYSGSAGDITPDGLLAAVYALKKPYRANAVWLMPRSAQLRCRTIKDANGQLLWQPGLIAGQPNTLLGYPVEDCEDLPDMAVGSRSIAFGDWNQAYQIIDRVGFTLLRDPFSKKPYVEFSARKRVGGDVVNFEALAVVQTGVG